MNDDTNTTLPAPAVTTEPPIVEIEGKRVITLAMMDKLHQRPEGTARKRFNDHKGRLIEGEDFYRASASEIRTRKIMEISDKVTEDITLLTESGYLMVVKSFTDDLAWEVQRRLVNGYFRARAVSVSAPKRPAPTLRPRTIVADFKALASLGPLFGYDKNQAALAANVATRKFHGVDLMAAMEITHLTAPQQARLLTPTDIGKELGGQSAMAVNALMQEHGYQVGKRDAKDRAYWEPTEAGSPFAVWQDTGKKHGDGTPVRQLKWTADIVAKLTVPIEEEVSA